MQESHSGAQVCDSNNEHSAVVAKTNTMLCQLLCWWYCHRADNYSAGTAVHGSDSAEITICT